MTYAIVIFMLYNIFILEKWVKDTKNITHTSMLMMDYLLEKWAKDTKNITRTSKLMMDYKFTI